MTERAGKGTAGDPRGLIREAFRIEGITPESCRSIFLDWALGLPEGADARAEIRLLLAVHAAEAENHPMKALLRAGLATPPPRRRRGRAGR